MRLSKIKSIEEKKNKKKEIMPKKMEQYYSITNFVFVTHLSYLRSCRMKKIKIPQ